MARKKRERDRGARQSETERARREFEAATEQYMAAVRKYGHVAPVPGTATPGGQWMQTGRPRRGIRPRDAVAFGIVVSSFLPYVLFAAGHGPWVVWPLLGWSGVLVALAATFIYGFKRELPFTPYSYDTVPAQLVLGAALSAHFGIANFCLATLGIAVFGGTGIKSVFDGVFYGIATVATLGYSDILPIDSVSRTLWMFGIGVGIWFVVTVLPVAIADQTERLSDLRAAQLRIDEAAERAAAAGLLKPVDPTPDSR
jgi:hypothetical protein